MIAIFTQSLRGGGVQKVVVNLANGLCSIGHAVEIVAADARGEMRKEVNDAIRVVDFQKKVVRGDLKVLASFTRLVSYIIKQNPDVVFASPGLSGAVCVLTKLFTSGKNTRIIVIIDDKLSLLKTRGVKGKINFYIAKVLYRFADHIVVAHKSGRNDLIKILPIDAAKISTIYHPLVGAKSEVNSKTVALNQFVEAGDKIILSVGRLTAVKDYPNLIEAFDHLAEKNDKIKLIILGDGEDGETLRKMVNDMGLSDKVMLPGYTYNPFEYMDKADVYVSSSRQEAFGNTIVEALSRGMTVVATDCASGGPREILSNGDYGYLCKTEDSAELALAIDRALTNPINKERAVQRGLEFSIDNSVKKYSALITGGKL